MDTDDNIYVICLLASIIVGNYVRCIKNKSYAKMVHSALGVTIVTFVCGWQSWHCFISCILGGLAASKSPINNCHVVTFIVMFGYLMFFRLVNVFNLSDLPGPTNMIQMVLTLKVAGVAFERNASWRNLKPSTISSNSNKNYFHPIEHRKPYVSEFNVEVQKITLLEILQYSFNYIGLLTGPYYRYRTYRDYFETPFKHYAPCIKMTWEKCGYASFYCGIYLLANYIWPLKYALSRQFYEERSFFYRLWYIWPTFFVFRMRMYTGLTLSESVCTMAGFGAYPVEADPNNGEGPRREDYSDFENPQSLTYDFTTIVNMRVSDVETSCTFRESMKHWNICVQYWLAMNVYKLFPYKKYRMFATLLCSTFWHGFRAGHYFCMMGAPFYVFVEDMWCKLLYKHSMPSDRKLFDFLFWFTKFFFFSYLGIAFVLVSFDDILKYYSSVYHVGYILWILLLSIGLILKNFRKNIKST